jgi:hypothetical protein
MLSRVNVIDLIPLKSHEEVAHMVPNSEPYDYNADDRLIGAVVEHGSSDYPTLTATHDVRGW